MAVFSATDYSVTVAGTDFSDHLSSAEMPIDTDVLDDTAFGDTWKSNLGGLKSGNLTLNFHQDFASSSVDSVLWTNNGTTVAVVVKPTSGSVSSTNPSYSFNVTINDIKPIAASVGDLATMQVTWPISGAVTRATS